MKNSIENIWKEGFINDGALVVPRVNQLYDRKSQHVIDRLLRMGRINLIAILIGASFLWIGSFFIHAWVAGTIIFVLLGWLVIYGQMRARVVSKIDKGASSYHYTRSFQSWLNTTMLGYTRIYRVFYPAFFLTFFGGLWFSDWGKMMLEQLTSRFPHMPFLLGMPAYFLAGLVLIAVLSSIFAGPLYRKDIEAIYGDVLAKLDEIVSEMELLREETPTK